MLLLICIILSPFKFAELHNDDHISIELHSPASALPQKNLDNAKASLEVLIADLQFLRDQVTITQ
ncbi:hypothetical protein MKW92_035854, partial [Papaver armeniacum]